MSREITIPHGYAPRWYQKPVWDYMAQDKPGLRASMVWHRRGGKDLTSVNLCCFKMFQRVGTYWHILPTYKQGRAIVWDGMDGTGRPFVDAFPDELVTHRNNVEMQITMVNGSKYRVVGSDSIDSLVGTNPIGVIFSEYSLQDPHAWDYIRPILAENGGWAMFIFTPRGKNHGYKLHQMAKGNPQWFASTLGADTTKAITQEAIDEERRSGMSEELIQQEYYCSFDAPLVGSYYSTQMENAHRESRITKVPWDPLLPVHTIWDLGMHDHTSIGFMQEYGFEFRFIDYYANSGEGLAHYIKTLAEKPYVYGKHYAPHDIKVKELGTGKTRWQTANELGIRFSIVEKHEISDGIEAVRNLLPRVWFDEEKCGHLVEALKSYRKEWNDQMKCYSSTPLHDWSSHPADMFRYFAWRSKDNSRGKKEKRQTHTEDEYDYLNG